MDETISDDADLPWLALFVRRDGQGAPERCADLAELEQALEAGAEAGAVLYEDPARALARALMAGQPLPRALNSWRDAATACLAVQRRHRRRLVMLTAPLPPEAAGTPLALGPGMTLPDTGPLPAPAPDTATALAALALSLDTDAAGLLDALQAATASAGGDQDNPAALLDRIIGDWREKTRIAAAAEDAAEERRLLASQVVELEAALRASEAEKSALLKKMEDVAALAGEERTALESAMVEAEESAATAAARQRESHERALGQLRAEAETLRGARDAARQEVESRKRGAAILSEQVAALGVALRDAEARRREVVHERQLLDRNYRARVARLSGMLDAVYKSTSWRMTGPMRSVVRRIRR